MKSFKTIMASFLACAWIVTGTAVNSAEPTDADRLKAYEDRVKTLEQHVRDLEKKLDEQSTQNHADAMRPQRRAPFSRDRFDDLMNQMRRQMDNDGAFGWGQTPPGFGQPLQGRPGMQAPGNRMRLGVALEEVSPLTAKEFNNNDVKEGAFVRSVVPGSPAEKAGIQVGDTITSFDNKPVKSPQGSHRCDQRRNERQAYLVVNRHGQSLSLNVDLGGEIAALDEDLFPNLPLNFNGFQIDVR